MNVALPHTAESKAGSGPEKKKNILIVDDDKSVRSSVAAVLRGVGYDVSLAANGQQALGRFDAQQVDLLLLDVGLPDQSGWDIFEWFTNHNPMLSVIIITGHMDETQMATAAGVDALMEKPLDAAQLLKTIDELLNEAVETRLNRRCGYRQDGRYVPGSQRAGAIGGIHAFQHR